MTCSPLRTTASLSKNDIRTWNTHIERTTVKRERYLAQSRINYAIQKRYSDYDEYLAQQSPIVIVLINFGGKSTF
jgi:hypothetical protein